MLGLLPKGLNCRFFSWKLVFEGVADRDLIFLYPMLPVDVREVQLQRTPQPHHPHHSVRWSAQLRIYGDSGPYLVLQNEVDNRCLWHDALSFSPHLIEFIYQPDRHQRFVNF